MTHLWLSIWSCKVATLTFLFWVWLNQLRGGVGTRKHWTIKNYHAYHEENADMAHNSLIGLNVHSNIIDIPYDCSTVFVKVFCVFLVDEICLRQSRTEDGPPLPPTSFPLHFSLSLWLGTRMTPNSSHFPSWTLVSTFRGESYVQPLTEMQRVWYKNHMIIQTLHLFNH